MVLVSRKEYKQKPVRLVYWPILKETKYDLLKIP
jgi:hypothetical protein